MRDYRITRNEGEWYHAKATDSYGNEFGIMKSGLIVQIAKNYYQMLLLN